MTIHQEAKPTFQLDGISLTNEEATNLFVHYVKMAMKLFEIVPDDENKFVGSKICGAFPEQDERKLAMDFADSLLAYHGNLSDMFGDNASEIFTKGAN